MIGTTDSIVINTSDHVLKATVFRLQVLKVAALSRAKWLVFLATLRYEEFFKDLNIPYNCEFLVSTSDGSRIILTEVYRITRSLPLIFKHFGNWTEAEGLTTTSRSFYDRRNNLEGPVITAGYTYVSYHHRPASSSSESFFIGHSGERTGRSEI